MSTAKQNSLRAYLETSKKPSYLLGPVERHLLVAPSSPRRTDVLHPSEITRSDWCIRASWFLLNGASKPSETINFRLNNIFAEGHAIHAKWQKWLTDMDVLIGVWTCKDHGSWWGKRSDDCLTCKVTYDEVPVIHEPYRIAGHADGWITGVGDADALLEIKSIGTGTLRMGGVSLDSSGLGATFRKITRPLVGHVRQAMLYLYVLRHMHEAGTLLSPPPEQLCVLYECKEDQATKEFMVAYNEEYLEPVLDKLTMLDIDADDPPPCTGEIKGHAKLCAQCKDYA